MENLYFNRELSFLKFNERVLEEANDNTNPIFERLKFVSIFSSNLDEFYMVRVGALTERLPLGKVASDAKTGFTPKKQLALISSAVHSLYPLYQKSYFAIMDELRNKGVYLDSIKNLNQKELKSLKAYFKANILPLLSPQIIDSKHPFGHLENKICYIGVSLKSKKDYLFGIIPIPKIASRLYNIPNTQRYLLLEDIVLKYADIIFSIYKIRSKTIFRVTRSADLEINESLESEELDYKSFMETLIKGRPKLAPVRLEHSLCNDDKLISFFAIKLNLTKSSVFLLESPLDLSFVSELASRVPTALKEAIFFRSYQPKIALTPKKNLIDNVLAEDLLISCPYESMRPIIDLLNQASTDSRVIAIKITLYRVSGQSQIISSLCNAAENGKNVTVMIELSARFDEKNNIEWASLLEQSGCHVLYGIENFKVHSKLMLITLKNNGEFRYITHISTGNYNEVTSRFYTDLSLLTSNSDFGEDAISFFQNLTISSLSGIYKYLLVSPNTLKPKIIELIRKEARKALQGVNGQIILKLNSLTDKDIINELIFASQSGVQIKLIIRGICCLRPNLPSYTENIEVRSIVGRFLEHSRIYCFGSFENMEEIKLYISSADMMTRNTERRVEVAAPILDDKIKLRICSMLKIMLKDNVKARILNSDGSYRKQCLSENQEKINSQNYFCEH